MLLIAVVGVGTFLIAKHPFFPILTVVLAFAAVTSQVDYPDNLSATQTEALSWVDHALPPGKNANLVFLGGPHQLCAAPEYQQNELTLWTEWFNSQVGNVESIGEPNPSDTLGTAANPRNKS